MKIQEISSAYLDFYMQRGYTLLPRASLLDPSVPMSFVMSAGLVQIETAGAKKGTLTKQKCVLLQKCFRHFDIEKVGTDDFHLSFFEMPASFTFGTIREVEVVQNMWRLLTECFSIDKEKLWVTFFDGGEKEGHHFKMDISTRNAWLELGLSPRHLIGLGPQHNLWVQGTGIEQQNKLRKCGPNTEVFWDRGIGQCYNPDCQPGCRCGRFLEIANTLFIDKQIDTADGSLMPIQVPFTETVIGSERLAIVAQNKQSVFEINYFKILNAKIESFCHLNPLKPLSNQKQIQILADHLRALIYLVADGAPPPWGTNGDKGGRHRLIRILIRRLLTAQIVLGIQDPHFISSILDFIIGISEDSCRLKTSRDKVLIYIAGEEKRFEKTLTRGKRQLERLLEDNSNSNAFPAAKALLLEKHYGLPKTMIEYELHQHGKRLDQPSYNQALQKWRKKT